MNDPACYTGEKQGKGPMPDRIRVVVLLLFGIPVFPCFAALVQRPTVGAQETVRVAEAGLHFQARIDTGAHYCSIHAQHIRVYHDGKSRKKWVAFTVANGRGGTRRIRRPLLRRIRIRSAEGSSRRCLVRLTLCWKQHCYQVACTLKNRRRMRYKLLVGRNWLKKGRFLVDVSRPFKAHP